ncbi:MAG: hypothetical protein EOO01_35230 [Chitinophagaceae bacterium]|nr:MAG: hypothetical protein EOO01_35230 [Chitinophagaceae bacterium]
MKKTLLLAGLFSAAALSFSSCSSDDNGDSVNNENMIAGTYNLSEVNTEDTTDFNLDGTQSENQMNESDCYDGSKITLNADGTLTYYNNYVLVNTQTGSDTCASETYAGTWEVNTQAGSTVVIDATYVLPNEDEVAVQLTKVGNKLTRYVLFGQYPDRNTSDAAVYTTGSIEYVFVK